MEDYRDINILVTGGAGFIGSNLVNALIEKKYKVFICDYPNLINKSYFKNYNLIRNIIAPSDLFEFISKNKISVIYHLGAISATTYKNPNKQWIDNVIFSTKLWKICSLENIRLIYASSAATYGEGDQGFEDIDDINFLKKLKAMNVYGWTKNEVDKRNISLKNAFDIHPSQWVALKFFNVYGINEFHKKNMSSPILTFYDQIKKKNACKIFGQYDGFEKGKHSRDFVYIDDVVDINIWASKKKMVNIFNVGTGISNSFKQIADTVIKKLKKGKIEYIKFPERFKGKYQSFTQANILKLRKLGYKKKFTTIDKGISLYLKKLQCNE